MTVPSRRTFLKSTAVALTPLPVPNRAVNRQQIQTQTTPAQGYSIEEVATTVIDTLDEIRETTGDISDEDLEKTIDRICSEWGKYSTEFKNGFSTINVSAARYVARTAGDVITILQDKLNLDLSAVTETLETALDASIDDLPTYLESHVADLLKDSFDDLDTLLKGSAHLIPVVGALLGISENGCEYNNKSKEAESASGDHLEELQDAIEEAREDFFICCVLLIVDMILIAFGIPYRVAFKGTRKIANSLLWRIRSVVGFDVFSVILKTVHWAIRGGIEESTRLIAEEIDEAEQKLEGIDIDYSKEEFIEVGYDESDVKELEEQTDGDGGLLSFDDEDSSSDGFDDDSGPLFDMKVEFPDLPKIWGNEEDDVPYFPG